MTLLPKAPSKRCPHRFCPHMHTLLAVIAVLVFVLTVASGGWRQLLFIGVGMIGSYFLLRVLYGHPRLSSRPPHHQSKRKIDQIIGEPMVSSMTEERASEVRAGPYLQVRKWWARAAFAFDVLLGVLIAPGIVVRPDDADFASVSAVGLVVPALVGVLVFVACWFTHRKATRPRRPKRVRVPAGAAERA